MVNETRNPDSRSGTPAEGPEVRLVADRCSPVDGNNERDAGGWVDLIT
jgi:hypothetical protein